MHTDEYEISLGRELAVCEQYVRKYQKMIAGMEQQRAAAATDSGAWEKAAEALRRWSAERDEYARLLKEMRISR